MDAVKDTVDTEKASDLDTEFEASCKNCAGTGLDENITCFECDGTGIVMTDIGERLLRFVAKRLRHSVSIR